MSVSTPMSVSYVYSGVSEIADLTIYRFTEYLPLLEKRSDGDGRFLIRLRSDERGSNHQRGKVDHQHVHRPYRGGRTRRRRDLLLFSRSGKNKGGHRFRSEPAPAERRHFEKAIKGGFLFCRAGRWHRDRLPKRVLEQ